MHAIKNRRGIATVEFALVVPLVFLVVLGLCEWCRFEMIRQVTSTATFNAARLASIPGATEAEIETKVNTTLGIYYVQGGAIRLMRLLYLG